MKNSILFILHLPPPIHGAAIMGKYIKDCFYLDKDTTNHYINLSTSSKLDEIGQGGIRKVLSLLSILIRVIRALFNKKYSLCYISITTTPPGFYKDLIVVCILKLFNKKVVYHFHNKGISSGKNNPFLSLCYRFVFRNCKVILLSPKLYSDIRSYVSENNVYYCPNGIPPLVFNRGINFGDIEETPCQLVFLSNMMKDKGVYVLLQACSYLKERGITFRCDFIGDWSDVSEGSFRDAVKLMQLTDVVTAHGKKYGDEKIRILSSSDIFVHPTLDDCFPLVLLEAMQLGLPIISSIEGGIPDIVKNKETGILVDKGNAKALADGLEFLITNPIIRKHYGKTAKERYQKMFTIEEFEKNFREILRRAIES